MENRKHRKYLVKAYLKAVVWQPNKKKAKKLMQEIVNWETNPTSKCPPGFSKSLKWTIERIT